MLSHWIAKHKKLTEKNHKKKGFQMKVPTGEVNGVKDHLYREFGQYAALDFGPCAPLADSLITVVEPMQSYDYWEQRKGWGSENLVDGCVPPGDYQVRIPPRSAGGMSAVYVDLAPLTGAEILRVFVGRKFDQMTVDWRAVKKFVPVEDPQPAQAV